ncbi:conserved exported hypothetical protein [uncultured Paludibacter sp.]|uniref:TonB-dependent receptor n=1 Tax=uncultured Paludibacter sp. TaxID=497635 RepID=A0A653A8D6_9BACT|nr:conserved exported hypothetical protein [uncultured Paludibacter sp.]
MRIRFIIIFLILSSTGITIYADDFTTKTDTLSEVVIEASKDKLKLNEIPASVSIISANKIKENNINSLKDLTSNVPNLFMPDYGSKLTSPLYIRGVGSRINAPSVGLYVDNVPYFDKSTFAFDFFDVQRIEVLRGPQGTEYGRNTMGGIINILTKSPWDYQGTHLDLTAGTYGYYGVNAGYYGKTNEKFAYSLALNLLHNDGFFTNQFLNNKVDKLNSYGIRNRLIYKFSDRFSVENIFSFERSNQGGYPYATYNDSTKKANKISYNQYSSYLRNLASDALVFKYITNYFDVKATTSYQYLSDNQKIDQDFTKDSIYFVIQKQKQNMISQEIILNSNKKQKYSWLIGTYGFIQQFNNSVNTNIYTSKKQNDKRYDHIIKGGALFHQSTLNNFLVKNLSLIAGIRMDVETDNLSYKCDTTNTKTAVTSNEADTTYNPLNSFEFLPKVALNYKWDKNNIYAVIARGYKTGGFNSTFERPEDLTFDPEYSWNYEIGVKSSLFNDFLYADLSLFYIDWKNQQIYQTVPSGKGSMLKNAGHSSSKGFETMLKTKTFCGFDLQASYGLTYAKFITFVQNANTDYSGNYIPYVPKHTLSLMAKKTVDFNSDILDKIVFNILYRGAGEIYWNDANSHKQDFYGLLDANISFIRKNFQFDIWGSNLTNNYYEAFYFEIQNLGKKYVQTGKPLQAGVKLSVNF